MDMLNLASTIANRNTCEMVGVVAQEIPKYIDDRITKETIILP
jgi:hypothetical protein